MFMVKSLKCCCRGNRQLDNNRILPFSALKLLLRKQGRVKLGADGKITKTKFWTLTDIGRKAMRGNWASFNKKGGKKSLKIPRLSYYGQANVVAKVISLRLSWWQATRYHRPKVIVLLRSKYSVSRGNNKLVYFLSLAELYVNVSARPNPQQRGKHWERVYNFTLC